MPRSAADATRFTATGPHAHSNHLPSSSSPPGSRVPHNGLEPEAPISGSYSGPAGETLQEKVARLKAAARQSKLDKISTFDKLVILGREVADRAHRVTVMGLITASVASGLYAAFALGDMVIFNRQKRKEFYAAHREIYQKSLAEATQAAEKDAATEEQVKLLEDEVAMQKAQEEYRNRKGPYGQAKEWLFSGMRREDIATSHSKGVEMETSRIPETVESRVLTALNQREEQRRRLGSGGRGSLDTIGDGVARGKGPKWWSGWFGGGT